MSARKRERTDASTGSASRARSRRRQHVGGFAGGEAREGGLGEHRDGALGIGARGRRRQDLVPPHHGPAANDYVARELVDRHDRARVGRTRASLLEQCAGAFGKPGVPAGFGGTEQKPGAPFGVGGESRRPARTPPPRSRTRSGRGSSTPACSSAADAASSVPTAAAARCHARRSTSRSGSAAASARWAARRSSAGARGVDRRAGQRVPELDQPRLERDQSTGLGDRQGMEIDSEPVRGPLEHRQIAAVAGRHQHQRATSGVVEFVHAAQERA